jgi:hypothetical protein
MKTKSILASLFAVALLALAPSRAAAQTVVDNLKIIQTAPTSGVVQAFWEKSTTVDGSTFSQPLVENSWKLADTGEVEITLSDGTKAKTTRAAVFTAVVTIATEEHKAQSEAAAKADSDAAVKK